MSKFTDAVVTTLQGYFDAGDQPTAAQFHELITKIQEGIEEHDHAGTGDGDGVDNLVGPVGIGCVPDREFHVIGKSILGAECPSYSWAPPVGDDRLWLTTNTVPTTNVGSVLVLGGRYRTADNAQIAFGAIAGLKENVTDPNAAGFLALYVSDAAGLNEAARFASTKYFGIGCDPGYRIHAEEDRADYLGYFFNDGNNDDRKLFKMRGGADANPGVNFMICYDGDDTLVGSVKGDGAGGLELWSASDVRLKDVLGPIDPALAMEALAEVTPIQYVGKNGGKRKDLGFSAQEVHKYFPEVATYNKEADRYGISYARLVPVLWAQNRELLTRLEALGG